MSGGEIDQVLVHRSCILFSRSREARTALSLNPHVVRLSTSWRGEQRGFPGFDICSPHHGKGAYRSVDALQNRPSLLKKSK